MHASPGQPADQHLAPAPARAPGDLRALGWRMIY